MRRGFSLMATVGLVAALVPGMTGAVAPSQTGAVAPSQTGAVAPSQTAAASALSESDASEREGVERFIVVLNAPPLARYAGGIAGLEATAAYVTGDARLDVTSPASRAYLEHLRSRHDALLLAATAALGREVEAVARFDVVLNGLAVDLTPAEARTVAGLPGVRYVEREPTFELHTDAGPTWIGADAFWHETPDGIEGITGHGVVVGIIDTGVNPLHPSFAEVGPVDGHVHSNPHGTYHGVCDPVTGAPFCNDKLIGIWDFTGTGPLDEHGHGSHVASTAAGNIVDAELDAPTASYEARISGVAPHANIISYKACNALPVAPCLGTAVLQAVQQVVIDGVDVLNYSIGGSPSNPWGSANAEAFLDLTAAGVFTATSAGNSGPGPGTVGSPGNAPWITTVGASTHERAFLSSLVDLEGGEPPGDLHGKSVTGGYGPARIVYAGDFGDELCGTPFPPGTWSGEIVVCDRGVHARVDKASNVAIGGAGGFVLANDPPSGDELIADPYDIPGTHLSFEDGAALKAWIAAGGGAEHAGTGEITGGMPPDVDPGHGDVMAAFSSRGPNTPVPSLLKPDVTAPGVDILAAWTPIGDPADYNVISGTSMSSPHVAGASALLRALRPEWSPDAVRSALMMTSFTAPPGSGDEIQAVLEDDGETRAGPFAYGAGRIDLRRAASTGLVVEESIPNYVSADPGAGGDPSALNLPSFADGDCPESCSWTRTLTSVVDHLVVWSTDASAGNRMGITVEPSTVRIRPGDSVEITVSVDTSRLRPLSWGLGEVVLTPSDSSLSPAHLPVAAFVSSDDIDQVELHFHGNAKDGCSGLGAVDVELDICDGPYLRPDPELDDVTAAAFGPVAGGLRDGSERNPQDAGWTWFLEEEVEIGGPFAAQFWASCATCEVVFPSEWLLTIWADGALAFSDGPFEGLLLAPLVTELVEFEAHLPPITARERVTVQINPYFDDMQGVTIFYDSADPCPGAVSTEACDSVVQMPLVLGPDLTVTSIEVRTTTPDERTSPADRARVTATVQNVGTKIAPSSETEMRLLRPDGSLVTSERRSTSSLDPGEDTIVEFSLDTRALRGDFTLAVEANAAWAFWELDVTNTVATLDVSIRATRIEPR